MQSNKIQHGCFALIKIFQLLYLRLLKTVLVLAQPHLYFSSIEDVVNRRITSSASLLTGSEDGVSKRDLYPKLNLHLPSFLLGACGKLLRRQLPSLS